MEQLPMSALVVCAQKIAADNANITAITMYLKRLNISLFYHLSGWVDVRPE
jgi:hypothetical protein